MDKNVDMRAEKVALTGLRIIVIIILIIVIVIVIINDLKNVNNL